MAGRTSGIRSERQYESLAPRARARYERELEVVRTARTYRSEGRRSSIRQAFRDVFGRFPTGRDYRHLREEVGDATRTERGRLEPTGNDRLYRGDTMPMATPDGVYEALPGSWRQRSTIGQHWSVIGQAHRLSDAELDKALKPFRGLEYRVYDPESGKVERRPFMTRPSEVRGFASSTEARQERVVSPRLEGRTGGGR
jgi:hypothetical protein